MTGAGLMDAKAALTETNGDLEAASALLIKKGVAKASKKADRATTEGKVHCYIHSTGKLGAMVEVLCETDFVARNELFVELCNDLALHVSACDPLYLRREDVPLEMVEKKKGEFMEELVGTGKPENILAQIIDGKMNKWYGENVLLEQPFIKDEDKTIETFVKEKISSLGENIQVRRFARFNIA